MAKIILGFTGLPACGKGTVAKYFVKKYKAKSFRFSDIVRDWLDTAYLPHSRENMCTISKVMRDGFGQDLLAKVMAKNVEEADEEIVVVEGIRRLGDIEHLKDLLNFKLVSVEADMKVRYQRLIERGENPDDKAKTWEEFQADHKLETEASIPEVMAKADIVVDNNGSLEELHKQLDKLVK